MSQYARYVVVAVQDAEPEPLAYATDVRVTYWTYDVSGFSIYETGDSNRDGVFNQLDIVYVLVAGKNLSGETASWSDGDWTGNGAFDQTDIIWALPRYGTGQAGCQRVGAPTRAIHGAAGGLRPGRLGYGQEIQQTPSRMPDQRLLIPDVDHSTVILEAHHVGWQVLPQRPPGK